MKAIEESVQENKIGVKIPNNGEVLISEVKEVLAEIADRLNTIASNSYQTISGISFDIRGLRDYESQICDICADDDAEADKVLSELWELQSRLYGRRNSMIMSAEKFKNHAPYNQGKKNDQSADLKAIMMFNAAPGFTITE